MQSALAGLLVAIAVVIAVLALVHNAQSKAKWKLTVERLGLTTAQGPGHQAGTIDGVRVAAGTYVKRQGKTQVRYTTISCDAPAPSSLALGREGIMSRLLGGDLVLGDPAFDRDVKVAGARDEVLAVLDAGARAIIQGAVRDGWTLTNGTWSYTGRGFLLESMGRLVARGVALAQLTAAPGAELGARLAERATTDPEADVRFAAFEALLRDHRDDPATAPAVDAALAAADPRLRLLAAEERDDTATFDALLTCDDPRVMSVAADALIAQHGRDRATIAAAVEPRLLTLLADAPEPTRLAAARALGKVGTIGAVAALVPLREKFLGGALKDAARDAILAIQARAGDVEAGRLAVVAADAHGAVSLAEPAGAEAAEGAAPARAAAAESEEA